MLNLSCRLHQRVSWNICICIYKRMNTVLHAYQLYRCDMIRQHVHTVQYTVICTALLKSVLGSNFATFCNFMTFSSHQWGARRVGVSSTTTATTFPRTPLTGRLPTLSVTACQEVLWHQFPAKMRTTISMVGESHLVSLVLRNKVAFIGNRMYQQVLYCTEGHLLRI